MAEMIGFSRGFRRPNGVVGGLVAALKSGLSRLASGRRRQLRFEEWPDYLLRDIGLSRAEFDRSGPTDWLGR
jgi:hypothetical protein